MQARLQMNEVLAQTRRDQTSASAGVNESGAEFGKTNIPGKLGTDCTWLTSDSRFLGNKINVTNAIQDRLL
jgi:hypothetical protein